MSTITQQHQTQTAQHFPPFLPFPSSIVHFLDSFFNLEQNILVTLYLFSPNQSLTGSINHQFFH